MIPSTAIRSWLPPKWENSSEETSSQIEDLDSKKKLCQTPENAQILEKWIRAGQDEEIFRKFPNFVQFLEESKILPYLRVSRDKIFLQDGKPGLLVEGVFHTEEEIRSRFISLWSPHYNQAFLFEEKTNEVYTYLDNGLGLENFHPYRDALKKPICTLSEKDFQKTLKFAQKFERSGEEHVTDEIKNSRTCIVQIVSSRNNGCDTNLHNLVFNPRHPWYRYIYQDPKTGKGKVHEISFGWDKSPFPYTPLKISAGHLRSFDQWNLVVSDERVVTSMAVTKEELEKFEEFLKLNLQREKEIGLGYQFDQHNCATFISKGQEALGIPIPVKMSAQKLIHECLPNPARTVLSFSNQTFHSIRTLASALTSRLLSKPINYYLNSTSSKVVRFFLLYMKIWFLSVVATLRIALGGVYGSKKPTLAVSYAEIGEVIKPVLSDLDSLAPKQYGIYPPGVVQGWQLKQKSTMRCQKPNGLLSTIVPSDLDNDAPSK